MLILPASVHAAIHTHARIALPEECCGALIGKAPAPGDPASFQIEAAFPLPNAAPTDRAQRYLIDPRDILRIDRSARARRLDIVGFYHSHPKGPSIPSHEDTRTAWESCLYLIAAPENPATATLRAWHFKNGEFHEIPSQLAQ